MEYTFFLNSKLLCLVDGGTWQIMAGRTRVREGHPMLDLAPAFFKPVEERVDYEWETADAPKRARRAKPAGDETATAPRDRVRPED